MVRMMKRRLLIAGALLMMVTAASAQTQRQGEAFSIQGYPGQTNATRLQERLLVDVQDLAQITNGSLSFTKDRITLTLPRCEASEPTVDDASRAGFSRAFMKAAIEAMAAIREWGGMLMITVQNGYPVGNNMAGNTIMAYQGRAADSVALASSAASNDSDYRGVELLRNEFNNVQSWADRFAKARSSMSAANITMSENALNDDEEAQKIIRCGQFLAQMFAGGSFQDDGTCH
jgi:hypothetical protein